jgi:hypothetical protein
MAKNQETMTIYKSEGWVEITDDDITSISFQVLDGVVQLRATVGQTKPSGSAAQWGWTYADTMGQIGPLDITAFTQESGANRIWAKTTSAQAIIMVDHD